MAREPRVSICIPTYNGARWIGEALASARAQTLPAFEILVCDDASTDDTVEIVESVADPRVRVVRNAENAGLVGNWNRCVALSRGELVKFLFQDDLLYPECLAGMVPLFRENERVGLVFARREVLLEDESDPAAREWRERYGELHLQFERIERLNRGLDLFDQYQRKGFRMNFVGEPTSVMVRRACFERLGGFNAWMHQGPDFEMWIRLMFFYDVGFVDERLTAFRLHTRSTTRTNDRENRPWLDMLWLLEGLLAHEEIRRSRPEIRRLRLWEALRAVKQQLERVGRGKPLPLGYQFRTLREYLRYRAQAAPGRAPALHPAIPPPEPGA